MSGASVAGPTLVLTELRAGHTDKAAEVAAALIKRDAKNPIYHTLLGVVRLAQRAYPEAEKEFRAALAIDPGFPAATRDLAQLYVTTGRSEEAKKVFTDLLDRDPPDLLFCAPGDSGAAVLDTDGRLAGLLWGATESGAGLATPVATVLAALDVRLEARVRGAAQVPA